MKARVVAAAAGVLALGVAIDGQPKRMNALIDLLAHEEGVAALLRMVDVHVDLDRPRLYRRPLDVDERDTGRGDHDDLPLFHGQHAARAEAET